jgi:hypothetical protein
MIEPFGPIGKREVTGSVFAGWGLPRNIEGIKCPSCKTGYAELVSSTEAECHEYGCGRDIPERECCAASFVCAVCSARSVGKRLPPEME